MKSKENNRLALRLPRIGQLAVVILVTCLSSYCTSPDKHTKITVLSPDERYLVDSYVRIATARNLADATPLKSESLFTALDSTIDSTRIANTIKGLNGDPDRWIPVYDAIEHAMRDGGVPQSPGKVPGTRAQKGSGAASEKSGR